jgi:glucosamine kinase
MPIYMGIDAGGTKTDCAIGNGLSVLGEASGETCKVAQVGEEKARQALHGIIQRTCKIAKTPPKKIERLCIGISGASVPGNAAWVQNVIHEVVGCEVRVIGDHVVAHHAAFGGRAGVLVIAGTGSIAFGVNEQGHESRAGGWGPIASDQGSAFWIGREAVATALREYDSGYSLGMFKLVLHAWNLDVTRSHEDVVRIANSGVLSRFSHLAKNVAERARLGDKVSKNIMHGAGEQLASLASTVIVDLWPDEQLLRVAGSGGVFQGSQILQRSFRNALKCDHPNAVISRTPVHPVLGALAIAASGARR